MRIYETAFLISPNLPDEDTEKVILQMADIVSKRKGKMVKQDVWGKRKLAYPIQKFEEAVYVFFLYEGNPDILAELERRFKQTEAILRFLTVRKETKKLVRKKKREVQKEEAPPVLEEKEVEAEDVDQKEASSEEPIEKEKKDGKRAEG